MVQKDENKNILIALGIIDFIKTLKDVKKGDTLQLVCTFDDNSYADKGYWPSYLTLYVNNVKTQLQTLINVNNIYIDIPQDEYTHIISTTIEQLKSIFSNFSKSKLIKVQFTKNNVIFTDGTKSVSLSIETEDEYTKLKKYKKSTDPIYVIENEGNEIFTFSKDYITRITLSKILPRDVIISMKNNTPLRAKFSPQTGSLVYYLAPIMYEEL
jgi:cell division protein YceG involved in septum cleavage